jgi:hypothetical protein
MAEIAPGVPDLNDSAAWAEWAFTPKGDEAPAPVADAPDDAVAEKVPDAPAEAADAPATVDEAAPVIEEVKLPFSAVDADGNEVPSLSLQSMKVTLKANGKEQQMLLADVVRKAQSEEGVQRAYRQERQERETLANEAKELNEIVTELRSLTLRMAKDDDFRYQIAEQIAVHESPEAELARAKEALAAEQTRQQMSEQERVVTTFAQNVVAPSVLEIVTTFDTVSQEELLGRFQIDTAGIQRNGVIPPEYHESLAEYLNGPFRQFAESLHAKRTGEQSKIAAATAAAERKAQLAAQRTKNEVASVTRPIGGAPQLRDNPKAPMNTVKERQASVMADVWGITQ